MLETLAALVLALVLLAPMMLGPSFGTFVRALGGEADHKCACGMPEGTCGCPECARIEHQRLRERAPAPYPVLRSQCEGNAVTAGMGALPLVIEAPGAFVVVEAMECAVTLARSPDVHSLDTAEPSTPPPRLVARS
jgi:hypothetical protein